MGEDQCRQFFEGYIEAKRSGEDNLRRIFRLRTDDDGDEKIYNEHARLEFKSDFTTKIRDMRSCGVTAAHCGFPLWQLVNKFDLVAKRLKRDRREVQGRVNGCMKVCVAYRQRIRSFHCASGCVAGTVITWCIIHDTVIG